MSEVKIVKYEGRYRGDQRHGYGKATWSDGSVFEGEWRDNKRNGFGSMHNSNGQIYVGEYRDDKKCGKGKYVWPNGGHFYEGRFEDNNYHGEGKFTFSDGSYITAVFDKGNIPGKGHKSWPNGDRYYGHFAYHKFTHIPHGLGRYFVYAQDKWFTQTYDLNVPSGVVLYTYQGPTKETGLFHGWGTISYPDGTKLQTNFVDFGSLFALRVMSYLFFRVVDANQIFFTHNRSTYAKFTRTHYAHTHTTDL